MKKLSICIPAYNRPSELDQLLLSIVTQEYKDYEIVISEDDSPERAEISKVVQKYKTLYPNIQINYHENKFNQGYDKNNRILIDISKGEYCFFMGNDDLICQGGLESVARILEKYKEVGVIIRSYGSFYEQSSKVNEIFKYTNKEQYLPPGPKSIAYSFRRSVICSGMVYHRELAKKLHTDIFDGTLLYQVYLVTQILKTKFVVFNPEVTVLYRCGGIPDFGNALKEQGLFTPKKQTIESSLNFVAGMIKIAKFAGSQNKEIFKSIMKDIDNYSYPIIAIQSNRNKIQFLNYVFSLVRLGLGKNIFFYIYVIGILFLGKKIMDKSIKFIKEILGYTPSLI